MKYYLIAGEASGDLHASNLMAELKKCDSNAIFRFFGGDLMAQHGGRLVLHYKNMAFNGLFEVAANINTIRKNMKLAKSDIVSFKPDVLILVDYPGFNLRIAKFAFENGIRVHYYISPKIWAWKKSRANIVKKYVEKMFVIFPFETEFYKQFNYNVLYVGNPLLDALDSYLKTACTYEQFINENKLDDKPILSLVPGSRRSEIKQILPEMLKAVTDFEKYQIIVTGAPGIEPAFYSKFINNQSIKLIFNKTYDIVRFSQAALVASGTATLETALLGTPQVVCYRVLPLTYHIGKLFVKITYFSLVNIVLNKLVVKELLQNNLAANLKLELSNLLTNSSYKDTMLNEYAQIRKVFGNISASKNAAEIIYKTISA